MKSNQDYMKEPDNCPFCNCESITSEGDYIVTAGVMLLKCTCSSCKEQWNDRYELKGYFK